MTMVEYQSVTVSNAFGGIEIAVRELNAVTDVRDEIRRALLAGELPTDAVAETGGALPDLDARVAVCRRALRDAMEDARRSVEIKVSDVIAATKS